jgi:hypothetical protein
VFRLFLYLALGYVIWKVIQIFSRSASNSRRDSGSVFGNRPPQKTEKDFKDVQDADFEELPPDKKK